MTITDEQKRQYQDEGYFLLENVIPPAHLQAMRDASQQEIDKLDAEMDRQGVTKLGINHKGSRYFLPFLSQENKAVRRFIFSDLMADICRATIGPEAFLFLDQYVIKAAEKGLSFSWHQDEGYIPYPNPPYVGCWCALDDVTEENGTVYMLPYSKAGTKAKVTHVKDRKQTTWSATSGTNWAFPFSPRQEASPCFLPRPSIAAASTRPIKCAAPIWCSTPTRRFSTATAPALVTWTSRFCGMAVLSLLCDLGGTHGTENPTPLDDYLFDLRGYLILENAVASDLLDRLNQALTPSPPSSRCSGGAMPSGAITLRKSALSCTTAWKPVRRLRL